MAHYVKVSGGTLGYLNAIRWIQERGIEDAEYNSGGWMDNKVEIVLPHFKFENEEDALAFSLSFDGPLTSVMPVRKAKSLSDYL